MVRNIEYEEDVRDIEYPRQAGKASVARGSSLSLYFKNRDLRRKPSLGGALECQAKELESRIKPNL